jgi:uncharacterized repeat protein (TIGR03843 family)
VAAPLPSAAPPPAPEVLELLQHGSLDVTGRIVAASNATLLCTVELDGTTGTCVYKPVRGEQPLWDFPDGTLAGREVGSYLISATTGWGVIPPTVLRSGPYGTGMVQQFIETPGATVSDLDGGEVPDLDVEDESYELIDLCPPEGVPDGWRPVLRAHDYGGDVVVLAHADDARLRRMAVLDCVINNADRKGGHVLHGVDGRVYGVDHGIALHAENKLRTVLWGWTGEPIGDEATEVLSRLAAELEGALGEAMHEHLTVREVDALQRRVRGLLAKPTMPGPRGDRMIPWPAF